MKFRHPSRGGALRGRDPGVALASSLTPGYGPVSLRDTLCPERFHAVQLVIPAWRLNVHYAAAFSGARPWDNGSGRVTNSCIDA